MPVMMEGETRATNKLASINSKVRRVVDSTCGIQISMTSAVACKYMICSLVSSHIHAGLWGAVKFNFDLNKAQRGFAPTSNHSDIKPSQHRSKDNALTTRCLPL